jgi:hypothetical protein
MEFFGQLFFKYCLQHEADPKAIGSTQTNQQNFTIVLGFRLFDKCVQVSRGLRAPVQGALDRSRSLPGSACCVLGPVTPCYPIRITRQLLRSDRYGPGSFWK